MEKAVGVVVARSSVKSDELSILALNDEVLMGATRKIGFNPEKM